jgi:hypothetical protein
MLDEGARSYAVPRAHAATASRKSSGTIAMMSLQAVVSWAQMPTLRAWTPEYCAQTGSTKR